MLLFAFGLLLPLSLYLWAEYRRLALPRGRRRSDG